MSNNILTQHLKDVADAIRAKKGTSELINPQDFSKEIASIEGGGSGENGGSNWRYFDTTEAAVTEDSLIVITMLFPLFKKKYGDDLTTILCGVPTLEEWVAKNVVATAIDFNLKICHPTLTGIGGIKTIEEVFNDMGGIEALEQALGFTEITKEEFYSLE